MSGSGLKEFKRVFVKDSNSSDRHNETDAIAAINKAKHTSKETVMEETPSIPDAVAEQKEELSTSTTIALTQDQLSIVV